MEKIKRHMQWIVFGLIVGICIGALEAFFGRVLLAVTDIRVKYFMILIFFLPFVGMFIHLLYQKYGKETKQGMGLLFEVGQDTREVIPFRLIPLVSFTTWLTHLFGGSAGREGVAIQIGGTFTNWFASHFWKKFIPSHDKQQQIILVTGMAAGFSGLFHTPIAATFFAMEVLTVGFLSIESLLSASIAAIVSNYVSQELGLTAFTSHVTSLPQTTWFLFVILCLLGCLFGVVGRLFSVSLRYMKNRVQTWSLSPYKKIFILSVVLMIFLILAGKGRYSGLGSNLIEASFNQGMVYSYDFILKLVFTIFTLAIGFQGGEVTPLFSIGSTLGVIAASILGLPIEFVAALGYVAVFSSATNTLIGPLFIAGEIFGFGIIPYAFVVIVFAYIVNGNESIYTKQKK